MIDLTKNEKFRIRSGIQCPECFGVRVEIISKGKFQCCECGEQWAASAPQFQDKEVSMKPTTKAQRKAIYRLWQRHLDTERSKTINPQPLTYRQFRKIVKWNSIMDCLMIPLWGMWIGIEKDGYTHS